MTESGSIILIDDEKHVRQSRKQTLELSGYDVNCYPSAEEALPHIKPNWPGVIVTDVKMRKMDGLELLENIHSQDPNLPVIVMTGHGDVPMAVKAMRLGAYDFIEKPCTTELFLETIQRALEKRDLIMSNRELQTEIQDGNSSKIKIIGKSPALQNIQRMVYSVAESDVDVLIHGETGTGKELVANYIHEHSRRAGKTFVPINCGALPETIIENELFGHEAGAFTGAQQRRIGKFEFANGGTIFLDEIESMPLSLQVKMLRVLQERKVERLGSNEMRQVDIRVIAATKIDLKEASARNEFREDLFYRLNVVKIDLPPLRERKEDIPILFQYFVGQACDRYNLNAPIVSADYIQHLMLKNWDGNIRELKNEAERFVLGMSMQSTGLMACSEENVSTPMNGNSISLTQQVDTFEKTTIEQELQRHKGDIKKTYTSLGIPRQTLYDKMNKYGLKRKNYVAYS